MATAVLSRLTEIRDAYARRRTLWRELSTYTTADDLTDIEAAIARCDDAETDPETSEIRRIVAAQRFSLDTHRV
ncbi:MAG TPA: hypothetical protein VGD91_32080 [Trebonia sp.]